MVENKDVTDVWMRRALRQQGTTFRQYFQKRDKRLTAGVAKAEISKPPLRESGAGEKLAKRVDFSHSLQVLRSPETRIAAVGKHC